MEILKASFDDKKTWDLLGTNRTLGVFQVESAGLTNALHRLQAKKFDSLIDMVALYRPGPLDSGMLDTYINRSLRHEPVVFDHPLLEPMLKTTFGVILYQEQCLIIANKLAGYTLPEADLFRKAISSKKEEMLEKERSKFIEGCLKHNSIPKNTAEKIFNQIVTFAGYAFNKSHSVCYALISYWTAYLKANFPLEYMASLLTSQSKEENIRKYIRESKDIKLEIGPPDINESFSGFNISESEENTIVFGLSKIKGIGEGVANIVIKNRPYKNFLDFIARIDKKEVDTRIIETFIKAGCFRRIEKRFTTKQLLENLRDIIAYYKSKKYINPESAVKCSLKVWELQKRKEKEDLEYSQLELAHFERETVGFYISTHPICHLKDSNTLNNPRYVCLGNIMQKTDKVFFTIGVLTDKPKTRKSRRGKVFHEIEIEDETKLLKMPIFGNKHGEVLETLKAGDLIAIKIRKSKEKIYVDRIGKLEV